MMKRPHLPANERHHTDPTDPISHESQNGPTRRPQVQKYERGSNPLYFLPDCLTGGSKNDSTGSYGRHSSHHCYLTSFLPDSDKISMWLQMLSNDTLFSGVRRFCGSVSCGQQTMVGHEKLILDDFGR